MVNKADETNMTVVTAKENRAIAAMEGDTHKVKLKRALLVIFAIMVAGPLELLIILYFS